MLVIVAPDKFGGSLTAMQTALALADGLVKHLPQDDVQIVPMCDGGEGFVDIMERGTSGRRVRCSYSSWRNTSIECDVWLTDTGVAFVESAFAIGRRALHETGATISDARSSAPLGNLLNVVERQLTPTQIVVGLGGTLCLDGGRGLLETIRSEIVPMVTAACDLDIKYTDAGRLTGPTKGALPSEIERISAELAALRLEMLASDGQDPDDRPFSGAAGGCAAVLYSLGGRTLSGARYVAEALGLRDLLGRAACVITAEARVDAMSSRGKVVGFLRELYGGTFKVFCREIEGAHCDLARVCTRIGGGATETALSVAAAEFALLLDTQKGSNDGQ